ncbi:MAG: hypothetical protein AB1397_02365 [bacterium]
MELCYRYTGLSQGEIGREFGGVDYRGALISNQWFNRQAKRGAHTTAGYLLYVTLSHKWIFCV